MIVRTSLGLTISLTKENFDPSWADTEAIVYSDEIFECSVSHISALIEHIKENRKDILKQIISGETVSLLMPQVDPPIIKVSRGSTCVACFTLGELWRWRFLKQLPDFPFKPHQIVGTKWLSQRSVGVLADDMGLGKTLQAIAALEGMHRSGRIKNILVVCPKSVIGVWEAEISIWAPWLCTVALYSGITSKEWNIVSTQCQVAIINYEAIRRTRPDPGSFDLVVFDEIHKLKNPKSINYSVAYNLKPKFAWGLSGTPLENNTGDLVAILHLLDRKRISFNDKHLPSPSLRSLASNYFLRRKKDVISRELPEVIEKTELIPLTMEQRIAYTNITQDVRMANLGEWIAKFNKLREICDYDPSTKQSSKINRVMVIVEAIRELGEKVLVFSYRIEPLRLLYNQLVSNHNSNSVAMITGQTKSALRNSIVQTFQSQTLPFVLLCSTRATAEGLTLTAANHVVFLNEWWNPAVNKQARDRVYRIGQTKPVYVYRLRSHGTVESRLDEILKTKSALFNEIIGRLSTADISEKSTIPDSFRKLL